MRYLPSIASHRGSPHPYAWTLTIVNLVAATALCALHVHAEENDNIDASLRAWQRITSGPSEWNTMDKVLFWSLIMMALEILNYLCGKSGDWMNVKRIPVRGKHLDDLSSTDKLFIGLAKAQTGPFLYILLRYCYSDPNVLWSLQDASFQTILLPLPAIFIIYDFFYTILHWFLHIKAVYPLIHKHHHHQKAPSRATDDAVNVHPVEFTLGEYNHLWAIFLFNRFLPFPLHIAGVLVFLATGGVLAGWNHTRFDISWSLFGLVNIFDSKAHDVHHRIPQSNYGQYTMFWDKVFGTYRPYDPNDRVNPKAQLDPRTGKSLNYVSSVDDPSSEKNNGDVKQQ